MKTTVISYSKCSIKVFGYEMDCPLCGAHVASGDTHECTKQEETTETRKPRKHSKSITGTKYLLDGKQ